jgi:photosystem II stability/assembly factor-like uncharacterized protein
MKTQFTLFTIGLAFMGLSLKAQWSQTSFSSGVVTALTSDATNLYAGSSNGVHVSGNSGSSFTVSQLGLGYNAKALFITGNTIFAGSTNGGVFTSSNSAVSWTQLPGGTYNAFAANGATVYAGTNGGILKSTNNGTSWSNVQAATFLSMAVSGGTVFGGSNSSGIYISTNGNTFAPSGLTNKFINTILVNNSKVFAGCPSGDGGLYVSNDNGATWTQAYGSITFNALVATGNNIFAATSNGVMLSTDNGVNWSAANNGLTPWDIRCLTIKGSDLYCGAFGAGVWKRPLSEMITGIEEYNKDNVSIFPNPTTGKFRIKSETEFSEGASLEVFNITGVKILEQESIDQVDLSFVPKGMYFVKITSKEKSYTKRLIVE